MKAAVRAAIARRTNPTPIPAPAPEEKIWTPQEVAARWGVSVDSVRRLFAGEAGVLRISSVRPDLCQRAKLRIPQSVLERVERQRSAA